MRRRAQAYGVKVEIVAPGPCIQVTVAPARNSWEVLHAILAHGSATLASWTGQKLLSWRDVVGRTVKLSRAGRRWLLQFQLSARLNRQVLWAVGHAARVRSRVEGRVDGRLWRSATSHAGVVGR
jgi:hypothetical protein